MNDAHIDKLSKIIADYCLMHQKLEPADVILALGSTDLRVAERAVEVWHKGLAPIVVVSGGFGRLSGSVREKTEADRFAEAAYKAGLPATDLIIENESTNTAENFKFSMKLLKKSGIRPRKIIAVTKPYMERRAYATAKKLFPDVEILMTSPQVPYEQYPAAGLSKNEMISIMVGDLQRIRVYAERGFSIPQVIPTEVQRAMEELIALGYTQHLVE